MTAIIIPIPNYTWYSFLVHALYILPLIIAISLFLTGIYWSVKRNILKSRNNRIAVWEENYLRKIYLIDKTQLLQKSGEKFLHTLIAFAQKWLSKYPQNFDQLCESLTNNSWQLAQLKNGRYSWTLIDISLEKEIKEIVNNISFDKTKFSKAITN